MAENVSISGTVEKVSDARAGWRLALDLNENLDDDDGAKTITIPASSFHTFNPTANSDFIAIKSPTTVNVTLTLSVGTFSTVPVRGALVLQTEGITTVRIDNPSAQKPVKVSVAVTKRSTT